MSRLTECQKERAALRIERDGLRTELANVKAQLADCRAQQQPDPPPSPPPVEENVLKQDTCNTRDPLPLWREISAVSPDRHEWFATGGPANGAFRRMTVRDGDDLWGERAELGKNAITDTFYVYREGTTSRTELWLRLAPNFPLNPSGFNVVTQWKQVQPHPKESNPAGSPILALEISGGRWNLKSCGEQIQQGPPAQINVWTAVHLTAHWSKWGDAGWVELQIDQTKLARLNIPTLEHAIVAQTVEGKPRYAVGDAIPAHLRVGPYHADAVPGCSLDIGPTKIVAA